MYKRGVINIVADSLSRRQERDPKCYRITAVTPITDSYKEDGLVKEKIQSLLLCVGSDPDLPRAGCPLGSVLWSANSVELLRKSTFLFLSLLILLLHPFLNSVLLLNFLSIQPIQLKCQLVDQLWVWAARLDSTHNSVDLEKLQFIFRNLNVEHAAPQLYFVQEIADHH